MTGAALLALAGLLYAATARCRTAVSLSDYSWSVGNAELNVSVPASFPSQVHLDLYAGQVIGNPLFGLNDFNLRWVAYVCMSSRHSITVTTTTDVSKLVKLDVQQ